jgi:ParB-like chromosome segregation protein Spo0J
MSSWRDVLKIHPACELFPLMSQAELKELGEDIKANGLLEKIRLVSKPIYEEVKLLGGGTTIGQRGNEHTVVDGRNRLDACDAIGMEIFTSGGKPSHRYFENIDGYGPRDVTAYVISANIRRRHLTVEDKRRLIGELLKANPERSNLQTAKLVGVSHPTVAKVRSELEETGDVEKVSTSTDTKGRQQPVHKPKTVSVKPPPLPTPAQRVEEKIRKAGIAYKKEHGDLSLAQVMLEVVSAADREELVALANHPAWERHSLARLECEEQGIDWQPASSAEQTAEARKLLYASDDTSDVTISDIRSVDPVQEPCENCETAAEHWQRSAENLAGDAISMRPYWTRQFGEWEKFDVPTSLVTLAKEAAKQWAQLACDLEKRLVGRV